MVDISEKNIATQPNLTKMKKILFISPLPPPHYGAALLSQECYDILKNSKTFELKQIKLNYSVTMKDVGKINLSKVRGIFHVRKQIKNELINFKPDLVYIAPATSSLGLIRDAYFSKIVKDRKVPILFHVHSRIRSNDKINFFKKKLLESMFENEKAIVLGKELINDINWVIPEKNLFILPNSIKNEVSGHSLEKILKTRRKNDKVNILFLSNMDESKGWPKVLEACTKLKKEGIQFRCNFVGEFPSSRLENKFNDYVYANGLLEEIKYLGKMVGKDKRRVLQWADIFVFPTNYELETFGLVLLEAMMFGLPVISNRIAAIPSVVEDSKTGYLMKKNSANEIAENIIRLTKNKSLREKMGLLGRKRFLQKFEQKDYSKNFISIIKNS